MDIYLYYSWIWRNDKMLKARVTRQVLALQHDRLTEFGGNTLDHSQQLCRGREIFERWQEHMQGTEATFYTKRGRQGPPQRYHEGGPYTGRLQRRRLFLKRWFLKR